HHRIRPMNYMTIRRIEQQSALLGPATPDVAGMHGDTAGAKTLQPCAQQWRRFHLKGKNAARRTDKSLDTEIVSPLAQGLSVEVVKPGRHAMFRRAVPRTKWPVRLAMGEVQATTARQEELSAH